MARCVRSTPHEGHCGPPVSRSLGSRQVAKRRRGWPPGFWSLAHHAAPVLWPIWAYMAARSDDRWPILWPDASILPHMRAIVAHPSLEAGFAPGGQAPARLATRLWSLMHHVAAVLRPIWAYMAARSDDRWPILWPDACVLPHRWAIVAHSSPEAGFAPGGQAPARLATWPLESNAPRCGRIMAHLGLRGSTV